MSNDSGKPPPPTPPPIDAGSQALADALRSSFSIVKFVMVVLFVVFLFSGFFTVGPREKAIKLRFGKPVGVGGEVLLGSGAHWAWPYPIDEVVKIPITEIQEVRSRTHWFAQTAAQEAKGDLGMVLQTLNPEVDGYLLTADRNIIHARATLRYRIDDPVRCVFGFSSGTNQTFGLTGISNAVLNVLDNALAYAAARATVDEALFERSAFQDAVTRRVVQLVQKEQLGIVVDQCTVETRQPRQLDLAFANVTTAGQNASQARTEAQNYRNRKLSEAEGEVAAIINQARAENHARVSKINGDAELFRKVLPAYRDNPELFVQLRLAETLGRAVGAADYRMYLPTSAAGEPIELRLNLNREPMKIGAGTAEN